MLDDKLKEILAFMRAHPEVSLDERVEESTIGRIKQAFADEGYIPVAKLKDKNMALSANDGKYYELMTGQEWLSRFEKELPLHDHDIGSPVERHAVGTPYTREQVLEAAKKASRVEG